MQVRQFPLDAPPPLAVGARHEPGGGGGGELDEVRAVGAAGRIAGGRGGQLLQAVPAQRLEQVVAHLAAVRVRNGDHQGLVDEAGEQLQRPRRVRGGVDGLGARQREPVLEDAQPGEQLPLGVAEQREAPVDDRPEAALPGDRRAGCRGEQVERPVEPARDLADADVAGPRGGQLDGQRKAVQPAADVGDRAVPHEVAVGRRHPDRPGAFREERHRGREREGENGEQHLALDGETLPAGRDDVQAGGEVQQVRHERCDLLDQVLAVVQHHRGPSTGQEPARPSRRSSPSRASTASSKPRAWPTACPTPPGVTGVSSTQPTPPVQAWSSTICDLDGEAGLAHAARADQRDQPGPLDQARELRDSVPRPRQDVRGRRTRPARPGSARSRFTDTPVPTGATSVGSWARTAASRPAQLRAGLDGELLGERAAGLPVGPQRVALPPAPVQRHHQLAPPALAQRCRRHRRLQLRHHPGVVAPLQLPVHAVVDRRIPQLGHPRADTAASPRSVAPANASPRHKPNASSASRTARDGSPAPAAARASPTRRSNRSASIASRGSSRQ